MTDDLKVVDELERRLLATYYAGARAPARRRVLRHWAPAATSLAALVAVLVVGALTLLPGSAAPPTAQAALDRAANAATTAPTAVLSPGKAWYARAVQTSVLPTPIPPRAGQLPLPQGSKPPTVDVRIRSVRNVWLTTNGSMKEQTIVTTSFVNSRGAALYGRPLQRPTRSTVTVPGHGRLASPLFPIVPLLSYRALLTLPTEVSQLRRVVSQLGTRVNSAVARSTPAPGSSLSQANQQNTGGRGSVTAEATGTVVGSCCGSAPVDRHAVEDLNVIAWLLALPVPPDVRAGLYRTAATLPGVRYDGVAHDALGRRGVEVSVGTGSAQMRLIFDPHTGALLASSVGFGSSALQDGFGPLIETLQTSGVVSQTHSHPH